MVQEIRSLQKLAIFFQGLTLGAEGGGLYAVLYGIFYGICTERKSAKNCQRKVISTCGRGHYVMQFVIQVQYL